jgi:hypothetical protein
MAVARSDSTDRALAKAVSVKTGSTHEIELFPGDWIAYVAAICAGLFCAVSLYWASGGTAGLRTVGGFAERMARASGSGSAMVIWVTVVVKAVGVILPLSLVRAWGRVVTRRWRAAACGAASVILVLYGGVQVISEALVELGMIRPGGSVDWVALRWHLELWDSWFLLWGLLLGTATWCFHLSGSGTRQGSNRLDGVLLRGLRTRGGIDSLPAHGPKD